MFGRLLHKRPVFEMKGKHAGPRRILSNQAADFENDRAKRYARTVNKKIEGIAYSVVCCLPSGRARTKHERADPRVYGHCCIRRNKINKLHSFIITLRISSEFDFNFRKAFASKLIRNFAVLLFFFSFFNYPARSCPAGYIQNVGIINRLASPRLFSIE